VLRETRYAYTVGRIRVAETRMLYPEDWERLLETSTVDGVLRILQEKGYPESGDYEQMLRLEAASLYRYLEDITPDPQMFSLFLLRNDCHNIKVLLKNEYSEGTDDSMLVENGLYEPARVQDMVRERDLSAFPEPVHSAFFEAMDLFSRTRDPQVIDVLIDQAYNTRFFDAAAGYGNPFLKEFAVLRIDTANIRAFTRIRKFMNDPTFLGRVIVDRGSFPLSVFRDLLSSPPDVFDGWLYRSRYRELSGVSSTAVLEKICDDLIMRFLRKTRYKVFGLEPVIGYLIGKETELGNVRIIAVGKINGIESSALRERMRVCYV
jgi:V/A-type H+/Na+-transporting ATPase subunit C